ncbi:hypothetical protein TeGR_g6874, partial [Tetraparma gracilis]
MLNASFCGVDDITGEQAVELQDRKMVLHGNPVTQITWNFQNRLKKIPSWLQTLEKVTYADIGWGCDVKEITGGAFPASLEELNIQNQITGLRLHPDSFEGLSKLKWLEMSTNKLTDDDMHPELFGDTKLKWLMIYGNPDIVNFDAAALFPGGSRSLQYWDCSTCGFKSFGDDKTNFHGLSELREVRLSANIHLSSSDTSANPLKSIDVTSFHGLSELETLYIADASLTSLPAGVFSGLFNLKRLYLDENDFDWLPPRLFADLCSATLVSLGDAFNTEALGDFTFAGIKDCNVVHAGAMTDEVLEICEAQRGDDAVHFCDAVFCKDGACSDCATETSCGGNENG